MHLVGFSLGFFRVSTVHFQGALASAEGGALAWLRVFRFSGLCPRGPLHAACWRSLFGDESSTRRSAHDSWGAAGHQGKALIHAYTAGNEPYEVWQGMDRRSAEYKALKVHCQLFRLSHSPMS